MSKEQQDQEEYETVEVKAPEYEEVEQKEKTRNDSYYDASLFDLIGYHILRLLITVFTLGIARPWADCMIIRYKVNHTVLNGKRLVFEGKGSSYFVQKFKWIFLSIITLGIYALWVPVKKLKWQVSQIHFEDETYISGESFFEGGLLSLIGINLLSAFLMTISLGLLYPIIHCFRMRWICKHTIINKKRLIFKGNALSFFLNNLLWYFLTIITLGIFGLWLGIMRMKWQVKNTSIKLKNEEETKDSMELIISAIIAAVAIVIGIVLFSVIVPKFEFSTTLDAETISLMKEEFNTIENKLHGRVFTDDEQHFLWNGKDQKEIRKIVNIEEIDTFINNGGNVYIRQHSFAGNDSLGISVTLKKNGVTCKYSINTKNYLDSDDVIECYNLYMKVINPLKGEKAYEEYPKK